MALNVASVLMGTFLYWGVIVSYNYGLTSDDLKSVRDKLARQRHFLESETFLTDSGQVKTLLDVSFAANHSERYYALILNKINTFVSFNVALDLTPVFLTVTLDGFFRDFLRGDFSRWPKYRESYKDHIPNNDRFGRYLDKIDASIPLTSKDLYKILSFQWHRFLRSYTLQKMKRQGFQYTFIRVTEPHKDGVPHFHVLFYLPERFMTPLYFHFRNFFPAPQNHKIISYARNGRKAAYLSSDVYETQGFQWKINSVAGYILKYILKTFRNVKENKEIDYLQAWYVFNRVPRLVTSNTLVPQDVYTKSSVLDDDWYYLTEIRKDAYYCLNRDFDFFVFDDLQGRRILYDSGYYRLTHHGYVVKEFGTKSFFWYVSPPESYSPLLISSDYHLSRLHRKKKSKYVYHMGDDVSNILRVIVDGREYWALPNDLRLRHPDFLKPVARLSTLSLYEHWQNFDFDLYDPKRFGLIQNELIKRGVIDGELHSLDDFGVDFEFGVCDLVAGEGFEPPTFGL